MMKGYQPGQIVDMAKALFREERAMKRLDGWFFAREAAMAEQGAGTPEQNAASELRRMIEALPISISPNAVFAGTQRDAFARTYALINPAFQVETFCGYCDPTGVFDDIVPNEEIPQERIDALRRKTTQSAYVQDLLKVYRDFGNYTNEVVFFVEQVTGHVIPDFRAALTEGLEALKARAQAHLAAEEDETRKRNLGAMIDAMDCALRLAERYADLAREQLTEADAARRPQLELMIETLERVPRRGARNLYEAMQSFMLLWQVMCLEQAPNPFALSVGYASHFGIDPKYFTGETFEEKGMQMKQRVIAPLFFNPGNDRPDPFYLYMNVTTPETLRKVLANPKKYAPSGIYIMRIHGTFVSFLDLSPAIQQDIIKRLDMASTRL